MFIYSAASVTVLFILVSFLHLVKRIWEHKNKVIEGFTSRHGVDKLVYFEEHQEIKLAIQREKGLKEWLRKWKLNLIEQYNPNWLGLYYEIVG